MTTEILPPIDAPLTIGAQIEARATHSFFAERTLLEHGERSWSYREYREQCVRFAELVLSRSDASAGGHVAMLLENCFELLALYGGCGYAGAVLFGVNTGLRGETLAGVLNQSRARTLVIAERFVDRIEPILGELEHLASEDIVVVPDSGWKAKKAESPILGRWLEDCLPDETEIPRVAPAVEVDPNQVHMVIYTSGTTGLPKGIQNNHLKLLLIGRVVSGDLGLTAEDCGYACMPLFHSNAIFLGFHPIFQVGGRLAIRERFSASFFVSDVLRHGVSFWNYVGEPVHYILGAVEEAYGGDPERIRRELTGNPKNRFRYALGNGAAPPDIDRFVEWFGLEDMVELYGSTEAAISTFRHRKDPRGSVGLIRDPAVKILDETGRECPPVEVDEIGKILNYEQAVGEICRVAPDTSLFQGYFENPSANATKYREGVYHSGDLGHVLLHDGQRFLYFDGRTEDWIRKDGENFSAAQVARMLQEHPDVALAAAYGVPCAVSDEWVMGALKLHSGRSFDPEEFFAFCREQISERGMDPKWFPDFIRIVDEFSYTETQKVLVRVLKREHFDRRRLIDEPIYRRTRGSTRYDEFQRGEFDKLHAHFVERERAHLLDPAR